MEYTTTTNGAVTNTTSGKECLDLFQRIGNMRWEHRQHILENFEKAFKEENIEMLMSTMADSVKWSPAWYNGNKLLGYDDLKGQLQQYFDQFDDVTFVPMLPGISEDGNEL